MGFNQVKPLVNIFQIQCSLSWLLSGMKTVLFHYWNLLRVVSPLFGHLVGIPEHITHKKDGLIFRSKDPEDLARKINFMLENKAELKKMGLAARRKVETIYSKRRHMEAILDIYQRCLSRLRSKYYGNAGDEKGKLLSPSSEHVVCRPTMADLKPASKRSEKGLLIKATM